MTGRATAARPAATVLPAVEGRAGLWAAIFGPPLVAYTAVLLADTATPTWNACARRAAVRVRELGGPGAGGLTMVTTPVAETAAGARARRAGRGRQDRVATE